MQTAEPAVKQSWPVIVLHNKEEMSDVKSVANGLASRPPIVAVHTTGKTLAIVRGGQFDRGASLTGYMSSPTARRRRRLRVQAGSKKSGLSLCT